MNKKFRAYYKPDLDTPDGALKFEQKEIDGDLFFVHDKDIWYPFQIPFLDDDWVVQQYVGLQDKNGVDIYEGDFIKVIHFSTIDPPPSAQCEYIREVTFENCAFRESEYCVLKKYQDSSIEIIGNNMENPKLLDKK
jgi:uncharacterized phage protein (TIGR01671 family)